MYVCKIDGKLLCTVIFSLFVGPYVAPGSTMHKHFCFCVISHTDSTLVQSTTLPLAGENVINFFAS